MVHIPSFSPDYITPTCFNDNDCALDETPVFEPTTPKVDTPVTKPTLPEVDPPLLTKDVRSSLCSAHKQHESVYQMLHKLDNTI